MKKMTKAMLMTALICGTMYCGAEPVHANELDTFTLDEYVVTAARTETKLVDTPANITIVGAEEIESRHYTNVAEVMKDVPGANVLDYGTGTSEKMILLNGDDRVLVLIDGRRVNQDIGMTNRATYDMNQLPDINLIERVEILKGAGGALYGSDAVGGVINVITKKADRAYGKVSLGYGSNGTKDMSAMYSFKQGKTGVTISAAKYEQDYYKYRDYASDSTKRWPSASDFNNEKVSLNISQEITKDSNITVGYDYSKYEGYSPYSISNAMSYGSNYVERETENIYAKYDWNLKNTDAGYLQVYHNKYEYFNSSGMEETTKGIDLQQVFSLSDNNKIVLGTSYREADVHNFVSYDGEHNIDNIAFFLNDTWEFIPSWTLNAGVRYDDHSEVGDETTFSAGLNKKINEASHAYINWSQVFKAPNGDDLYYYQPNGSWKAFSDPNLKPETGDTWTIGYNTMVGEKTDIGINYFESDLDDAIAWDTIYDFDENNEMIGGTSYVRNVEKQKKRGMEFTLNHEVNDNVDLEASYTYIRVKEVTPYSSGKFVKDYGYVPNTYRFGIRYHDMKWNADLFLRAGSGCSGEKYLDSNYLTVDMAVSYKAAENIKLFAKGYNLLNERYAEVSGYSKGGSYNNPAQSRRFLIGAEYSF